MCACVRTRIRVHLPVLIYLKLDDVMSSSIVLYEPWSLTEPEDCP